MSILPTVQGLLSEISPSKVTYARAQRMRDSRSYLEDQFWLLHQDLALWTCDEIKSFTNDDPSARRGTCLDNLTVEGPHSSGRHPWSIQFRCLQDFPALQDKNEAERRSLLQEHKAFLRNESSICLLVDGTPRWFGFLTGEEDYLCLSPPVINIRLLETELDKASLILTRAKRISCLLLHTPLFAYEPVLNGLSRMSNIPLEESLLHWTPGKPAPRIDYTLTAEMSGFLARLEEDSSLDLRETLRLSSEVRLDPSQAACFKAGLSQSVALIQGPPGTGKSFIGSLIAKAIIEHSAERILLVCQTHHALDQLLTDCLRLGLAPSKIVRMGSTKKATQTTQSLSLHLARSRQWFSPSQKKEIARHRDAIDSSTSKLRDAFNNITGQKFSKVDIMKHIKTLKDGELPFYDALHPPPRTSKPEHEFYLLDRWLAGKDCGVLKAHGSRFPSVWRLNAAERKEVFSTWEREMMTKRLVMLRMAGNEHDDHVERLNAIHRDRDINIIRRKRIIACTTTAAAKYMLTIQSAAPTVVFVEEAGQILESHILTALGPRTKQLVMIGDHKQLRPRAHHNLCVEKGNGFDLNRSLFERLILAGYPHQVLSQQHRMRPEIAALVRELSHPSLTDAPRTLGREHLRGLQNNVIFVSHSEQEFELGHVLEWRDFESTKSKRNLFEAQMVVKCVQHLTQQGYSTERIAVLTPYLGQLRLLIQEMLLHSDPQLSELDSQDLVRAGLTPPTLVPTGRPHIRVSTIDNFQGDESDIVISSLTRSNSRRDIGFMASRERLNVLLSRARDGLILVGDAETFRESPAKDSPWNQFIDSLVARGHMYDGLPTRCERHKINGAVPRNPEEFEKKCPGGGCRRPCEFSVLFNERYRGGARIEGGMDGLPARVFCRRLAKAFAGLEGVEMRVTLEKAWEGVIRRKKARSSLGTNTTSSTQEEYFSTEDLLGPEPREYLKTSSAWKRLQNLIGVQRMKDSMAELVDVLQLGYELELKEEPPVPITLSRLFLGQHGTGKTTVCWLYASILSDLGVIQSSDVVFKHPDDLIGDSVEASELRTEVVLQDARGKVLAIRDAPVLRDHRDDAEKACRIAVIRKLLAAAGDEQENPQCLILMFISGDRALNTFNGLGRTDIARYFPIDAAFSFDRPEDEDLSLLLDLTLRKRRLSATVVAKEAALHRLQGARGPRFGNARAVETLVDMASDRARLRQWSVSRGDERLGDNVMLEEEDFSVHELN
ncbi:NFX1-type zinc finger-containing protein 1, partial [Metarhizium brunneum ARSEF 3297]